MKRKHHPQWKKRFQISKETKTALLYLFIATLLIVGALVLMLSGTPEQRLWKAVLHCDVNAAKDAIERGADVNTKSGDDDFVPQAPVLFFAARNGCTEIVTLLLAAHADVNATVTGDSYWGWTALKIAEENGRAEIVRLLKAAGAE